MDRTAGFAYRCLPLNIANGHGWMILNEAPFFASWDGNDQIDSVRIVRGSNDNQQLLATTHFGFGVLTFSVNCLFRTSPGYDLWVTGPVNMVKDAIQPLTAVIETDWSPATFTMNWRFTREHTRIWFDRGEPFCMIFPVRRGLVEQVTPQIRSLENDRVLEAAYQKWLQSRLDFNKNLATPGSEEQKMKWQKHYVVGRFSGWPDAPFGHRTKIRAKPFK